MAQNVAYELYTNSNLKPTNINLRQYTNFQTIKIIKYPKMH